jgi:hypothetical protein
MKTAKGFTLLALASSVFGHKPSHRGSVSVCCRATWVDETGIDKAPPEKSAPPRSAA